VDGGLTFTVRAEIVEAPFFFAAHDALNGKAALRQAQGERVSGLSDHLSIEITFPEEY
jgi:hypothetical protein